MSRKYFGTDGVRGVANVDLTPELAYRLGRAAGYIFTQNNEESQVVIGRDTRISCDLLESSLTAGLLSVGVDVIRLGVCPTPAVAFVTKQLQAQAGVMISASHNPFEDNGIKFFNNDGFKLSDETEHAIENLLDDENNGIPHPSHEKIGRIYEGSKHVHAYIQHLKESISNRSLEGLHIVLDTANGASSFVAEPLFSSLGATVTVIHNEPNGMNINVHCGSTHPEDLQKIVVEKNAHLGLAFDGDADRLIAADEKGNLVDGDRILYLLGTQLQKQGKLNKDTIVSTVMSNFGFTKSVKEAGLGNIQAAVGDRYVLEEMQKGGFNLGGEQSGHVILLDHTTTGDGVLTALHVACYVAETGRTLSELVSECAQFPQLLVNVRVADKTGWEENEQIQKAIADANTQLEGNGRILVRASGTENLIRVMVEGKDEETVNTLTHRVADVVKKELTM